MKLEWKTCFKVGISIFLLYICIHFFPTVISLLVKLIGAASPLIIGCVIAYLVNILLVMYEKIYFPSSKKQIVKKTRRPLCMLFSYLTLVGVLALVVILVVPQFISCINLLISQIPDVLSKAVEKLQHWEVLPENIKESLGSIDWNEKIQHFGEVISSGAGHIFDLLVTAVSSVFSGIITGFLSVIFSIYLLASKEKLGRQVNRVMEHYIKSSWYKKIMHLLNVLNTCFRKYFICQCFEALILGILCTLGMLILDIPYALMIGALVAITALIPIAGAYIGAIVGAFMILTVSPVQALIFLVFLIILQQLEENLIYPRVVGSSIGLPSFWVLAAITIGGGLLGIIGMIIGVPLAAAIYKLLREDINRPKVRVMKTPRKKKEV